MSASDEARLKSLIARMQAGSHEAAWRLIQLCEPRLRVIVRRRLRRAYSGQAV